MENDKGVKVLEWAYQTALNGVPKVSESLDDFVQDYVDKYGRTEAAIDKMVAVQKLKCTTTGFITGIGGVMTLPVSIPADLASSLYMEIRMIAAIAMLRGYNVYSDEVKTLVYLCIAGNAVSDILKNVGIKTAQNLVVKKLLPMLTRELIVKINKAVGFRILTKGGSKGLVNAGKAVPVIGGFVGGAWNYAEVAVYAKYAKKMFNENA